jgi:DtxR family Mn-dependent transcriptional regulator
VGRADLRRGQAGERDVIVRLSELEPGLLATIVDVDGADPGRLHRLSVLGVVPGREITVEQRRPAFVMRIDHTTLSVERAVADHIRVRLPSV